MNASEKAKTKAWKGAIWLNWLIVNIKKSKMIINSEGAMQVIKEGTFPNAVSKIDVASDSVPYDFSNFGWIRGVLELEEDWSRMISSNDKT